MSVSAWRSTEAQVVSKKRGKVCHASEPRARSCPHHGNSQPGVLLLAERNTVGGALFKKFAPALTAEALRGIGAGEPTDFSRN